MATKTLGKQHASRLPTAATVVGEVQLKKPTRELCSGMSTCGTVDPGRQLRPPPPPAPACTIAICASTGREAAAGGLERTGCRP